MTDDVLTREQLEAQLARREAFLEKCRKDGASEKMLQSIQKDILLTRRRLERLEGKA